MLPKVATEFLARFSVFFTNFPALWEPLDERDLELG